MFSNSKLKEAGTGPLYNKMIVMFSLGRQEERIYLTLLILPFLSAYIYFNSLIKAKLFLVAPKLWMPYKFSINKKILNDTVNHILGWKIFYLNRMIGICSGA